jgi:Domain of unknown function (DUF5615)
MTLLVDNQLASALARFLSANAAECLRVRDVGLDQADDATIWGYAKEKNYAFRHEGRRLSGDGQSARKHPSSSNLSPLGELSKG